VGSGQQIVENEWRTDEAQPPATAYCILSTAYRLPPAAHYRHARIVHRGSPDRAGPARGSAFRLDTDGRSAGPDSTPGVSGDTPVAGAELQITEPKATCRCQECHARQEVDEITVRCPACGSERVTLEGGRELLLQSIEIED
jgi:ribosomal protein S27E